MPIDVTVLDRDDDRSQHFTAYLPPGSWFLLVEPAELEEEGRHYLSRLERPQRLSRRQRSAEARSISFPSVTAASIVDRRWKRPAS